MDGMENRPKLMRLLRKTIESLFPWMNGPHHMMVKARVVKVHTAGGKIDEFNSRYSVDVQPLDVHGNDDPNAPVIPDVEMPVIWAGPNRGIYCLPTVGSLVRLGYYYHDPAHPYIDAILGHGHSCPDHPEGSLIIQHSDGCRVEITPEKDIKVQTTESIRMKADGNVWIETSKTAFVNAAEKIVAEAPMIELAGGGPAVATSGMKSKWRFLLGRLQEYGGGRLPAAARR